MLCFAIADIAGKGLGAALLMANLQAALRSHSAMAIESPERLLATLNQLFYENTAESSYATLFLAVLREETRHVNLLELRTSVRSHCPKQRYPHQPGLHSYCAGAV